MKIRKALLALVGVTTLMTAVSAKPADAATAHRFRIEGFMNITDDEIRSDEFCPNLPFAREATVDHGSNNLANPWASGSCGGEVRIEVDARGTLVGEKLCNLAVNVSLYEGTSTLSRDLDGRSFWNGADRCMSAGAGLRWASFRVDNTAEGGDHAEIDLTLRHLA
jgi:hypothetical protein